MSISTTSTAGMLMATVTGFATGVPAGTVQAKE
jgi:hypothetical protein